MDSGKELFGYGELAFFGKVNASISHELKNVMAIISETAGLLGDLSDLASSGSSIEPDMLRNCTESIIEEIERGFSTIRQMNRFAHSVDAPIAEVDLTALIELVVALAGFLSFSGKARLHPVQGDAPTVYTCPFIVQAIIYQALVYAYKTSGIKTELDISVEPRQDSGWRIVFSRFYPGDFEIFPDAGTKAMASAVGMTIRLNHTADRLELDVPASIDRLGRQSDAPDGKLETRSSERVGRP